MPLDIQVAPTTSRSWSSAGSNRFLAFFLAYSLTLCAQQAVTLKIRALDPSQLQKSLSKSDRSNTIIIVEDSSGAPVPSAAVSFRLPDDGPSGTFANGLRSEIAITGLDGRASIAPIHWADQPGTVPLRVTAAKGPLRAGVILNIELSINERAVTNAVSTVTPPPRTTPPPVELAKAPVAAPIVRGASIAAAPTPQIPADLVIPKYDPPAFWRSKWFLILVAGGGAVAAGYAVTKLRTSSAPVDPFAFTPGSITQVPVVIGPPTITITKP